MDWNSIGYSYVWEKCGHTLRGCVDWNISSKPFSLPSLVTPYVGVWIETILYTHSRIFRKSHPTWVCGLKLLYWVHRRLPHSHTLRGCVDWNLTISSDICPTDCHTLRGCVDWNFFLLNKSSAPICHTLRGCVDWNLPIVSIFSGTEVTPYVGVWIETSHQVPYALFPIVTPYVGVWIETDGVMAAFPTSVSHPTWVCGLKPFVGNIWWEFLSHTLRGCVDWNSMYLFRQMLF